MIDGEPIKWLGGEFYFDFQTRESRLEPMEQHLSHLAGKENLKILEIGSCEGQSTLWFIKKLLTGSNSNITYIDAHGEQGWYNEANNDIKINTNKTTYEVFKSNILDKYSEKVIYHREKSNKVLPDLEKRYFDLIYVDGDHSFSGCYEDGELSIPLLKNGGIIMFDDYWENDKCPVYSAVQKLRENGFIIRENKIHNKAVLILKMQ